MGSGDVGVCAEEAGDRKKHGEVGEWLQWQDEQVQDESSGREGRALLLGRRSISLRPSSESLQHSDSVSEAAVAVAVSSMH